MKTCSSCGRHLPVLEFNRNASEKDGLQRHCKACRRAHYERNREAVIGKACARQRADPGVKAAYDARRRSERADELRQYERSRSSKPHRRSLSAKWAAENPDQVLAIKRRSAAKYRPVYAVKYAATFRASAARRRAAVEKRTPSWFGEFDALVETEAFDLALRRADATGTPWEVDHDIPLRSKVASGLHVGANMRVVPASFNRAKGAKLIHAGAFGLPHFERRP